jgi:hypothetical protein
VKPGKVNQPAESGGAATKAAPVSKTADYDAAIARIVESAQRRPGQPAVLRCHASPGSGIRAR